MTVQQIFNDVCKKYVVTMEQIKSPDQTRFIVEARQYAMYLLKKYTKFTLAEIGLLFDKDHSTVSHAIKAINNRLETGQMLVEL